MPYISPTFFLEPEYASEQQQYFFSVNTVCIYKMIIHEGLIEGRCSIHPNEGILGITEFTLHCTGYSAVHQLAEPISFDLYERHPHFSG